MKRLACLLVTLAACPPPGGRAQTPVQPAVTGAGCPAATNIHVASYLTQDEHGAGDASAGHTGWVLPLHDARVDSLANQPEYAAIDASAAAAQGVPVAPPGIWLMAPGQAETFAGFFVAGLDGKAIKVTEGQDHPLLLSAVLADRTGPRALVAEGSGEYTTYELSGGAAKLARHLVWLVLPPEAYAVDEQIGPSCAPDAEPH
jgi:hypothetical protein